MGQGQPQIHNSSIYKQEYLVVENIPEVLTALGNLLKTSAVLKINDHDLGIGKEIDGFQFTIRSKEKIEEPELLTGFVEIFARSGAKVFEGTVANCKRQGFGVEYGDDGKPFFKGEFSNNLYHGWGCTPQYQGEYRNGRKQGWGVWEEEKIRYEGLFSRDRFQGIGFLNVENRKVNVYISQNDFLPQNDPTRKYVGEWSSGKMNGRGKLVTATEIYTGDFEQGLFHGEGKLIDHSRVAEGRFYRGKKV